MKQELIEILNNFDLPQLFATLIGMYSIHRFLIKDIHKEINLLKEEQKDFKIEIRHINNRLDGLYRILLDKTYGKNIPEELK